MWVMVPNIHGAACTAGRLLRSRYGRPRCRSTSNSNRIQFVHISFAAAMRPSRFATKWTAFVTDGPSPLVGSSRAKRWGAILNAESSFQRPEASVEMQTIEMPDVPPAEVLEQESWSPAFQRALVPADRVVDSRRDGAGRTVAWMKVSDSIGDPADPATQLLHRCWLAIRLRRPAHGRSTSHASDVATGRRSRGRRWWRRRPPIRGEPRSHRVVSS